MASALATLTVHLKVVQVELLQVELPLGPPEERDHVLPGPDAGVGRQTGRQLALVVQQRRRGGLVQLRERGEPQGVAPEQVRPEGQREPVHGARGYRRQRPRHHLHPSGKDGGLERLHVEGRIWRSTRKSPGQGRDF